ncbi:MAG: hypothetical protein JOZ07_19455 [Solirubrobacterales bacterium]|nr:hypothetical protein [Solirubrobacterales bacterium]
MTAPAPPPVVATAELPEQDDPVIGQELIRVTMRDGSVQELRLHDYARLYALPGVYEQIVQKRLQCSPGLYEIYLTLDLLALGADDARALAARHATALACVAPVGDLAGKVPVPALMTAAGLLAPDALVAYMYDPAGAARDAVTPERWRRELGGDVQAVELRRERYVHRRTCSGGVCEMEAAVWRVRRPLSTP